MATAKKPAAKAAASTAVAVKKEYSVATMQDEMKAELAKLGERTAPQSGAKIRITKGGIVTPDGIKHQSVDLVVLDFIGANNYYESQFDREAIVPPTCFARGAAVLKLVPSENSPKRQNDTCQGCWANEFKSATNGRGKACSNNRFLAVVPASVDGQHEAAEDDQMLLLSISPTKTKMWDGLVASIARVYGTMPVGVIVTLTLDTSNDDYVSAEISDPRPNPDVGMHWQRREEAREFLMAEPDVSGYVDPDKKPAPAAGRKPAAKQAGRR